MKTLWIIIAIVLFFIIFFTTLAIIGTKREEKYKNFVEKHSKRYKALKELFATKDYESIKPMYFNSKIDRRSVYEDLECTDVLVYYLFENKSEVLYRIAESDKNQQKYDIFLKKYNQIMLIKGYDAPVNDYVEEHLQKDEEKLCSKFNTFTFNPFYIECRIDHYDRFRNFLEKKRKFYNIEELEEILPKIYRTSNGYINDVEIWNSCQKVERSFITNKLKWKMIEEANYTCQCYHRNFIDNREALEIDHIIPISKGGKSTTDNLQVLCHECNMKKGNTTRRYKNEW